MKSASFYLALFSAASAVAFSPASPPAAARRSPPSLRAEPASLTSSSASVDGADASPPASPGDVNDALRIPLTYSEMILQASRCMSDAYALGMKRQVVRVLLPRDASSGQLGEYLEAEAETSDRVRSREVKLVPTDESWQGGIMQLYRAASPTTKDIMRQLSPTAASTGVPPRIVEDRSIDESGVDGVGLLYTRTGAGGEDAVEDGEGASNGGGFGGFLGGAIKLPALAPTDACVFVQPSQEVVEVVEDLSASSSSSLIALLNPQWRNVDDALDSASKSDSVFGAFASFLGGKGSVLRRLNDLGYEATYTLEGYVCKGGNVRLIKRFDSDWIVFAENDSGESYIRLGSTKERPSYQDVEKMLDDKGVGYKYARDLGMAPKL